MSGPWRWLSVVVLAGCASAGAGEPAAMPAPAESRLLATEEAEARRSESSTMTPASAAPPAPVAPVCSEFVRPGVLSRAAVVRVVDRGLGQWLSRVKVAPARSGRKFTGWQIRQLDAEDPCWRAVDLQAGDVVTRLNGASLEKPDQANKVFQSLRAAPGLEVGLLRQGVPRRVSLTIAD
jgi:hypothetical protein